MAWSAAIWIGAISSTRRTESKAEKQQDKQEKALYRTKRHGAFLFAKKYVKIREKA